MNIIAAKVADINYFSVQIFDELLPGFFDRATDISGEAANADFIIGLIQNGLILLFVGVLLAAIVFSAIAGIKFITSQGASEKVEEAQEALKNVLVGVAAVFLAIIGIFIITNIFSDTSAISLRSSLECFLGDTSQCT
jgi:succinate dehydrogenase/fumarate reductase cytochrome b subunit